MINPVGADRIREPLLKVAGRPVGWVKEQRDVPVMYNASF